MKNYIYKLIIVIIQIFCNYSFAQNDNELGDGKIVDIFQNAPDSLLPVYIGEVPNMRDGWEEISTQTYAIIYAGPGYYYDPALFMRLNQYYMIFTTGLEVPFEMQIKYDEGQWLDVDIFYYNDLGQYGSSQLTPPWNETGEYEINFRWMSVNGDWQYHYYLVYIVPPSDHLFTDDEFNRLDVWLGNTALNRPMILAEGIDANNQTYPPEIFHLGADLFNAVRTYDTDIVIINFAQGGRNIVENAQILDSATRYLASIQEGDEEIILSGLSMGGVVARYALAVAEDGNDPLPVSHFLSLDSPQQGAVLDDELQDFMHEKDDVINTYSLQCFAAKQLLQYNTYDQSGAIHDSFFNDLNAMANNGYPENCLNIGVTFSNGEPNPNENELWLKINFTWPIPDKYFYITGDIADAGSYLPEDITRGFGRIIWGLMSWEIERYENPTFIPYESALDVSNNISRFDVTIEPGYTTMHDDIPEDIVYQILAALSLLPDSESEVFFYTLAGEFELGGELLVNELDPVFSGEPLNLNTNEEHNVISLIKLFEYDPTGDGFDKQHQYWNETPAEIILEHSFWGWQSSQIARYESVVNVIINNQIGNITLPVVFHDPWYLENANEEPNQWTQPNEFRSLSEQADEDGNLQVFLNQLPSYGAHYEIRAPQFIVKLDGIYEFSEWIATPSDHADFGNSSSRETDVVFLQAGVTITPNYTNNLSGVENTEIIIGPNDQLTIPAGVQIDFARHVSLKVRGTLNINGTATEPIVLKWHPLNSEIEGIRLLNTSTLNVNHCVFQNATTAINMIEPLLSCTINHATFTGNQTALTWESNHAGAITISNSAFHSCTIEAPGGDNDPTLSISYSMFDIPPINVELSSTNEIIEEGLSLIDPANGNYRPDVGSPLIDEGNPNSPNDPDGTPADIGAFYYVIPNVELTVEILGEVGDHPQITWTMNNPDNVTIDAFEVYSYNEFDQTPVYFNETMGFSLIDSRFTIVYMEETETERNVGLRKLDKQPEQTTRIKQYWTIKVRDTQNHLTDYSEPDYARVEASGEIWKLATPFIPKEFELNSAFPNPFNPIVTIPFGLPVESDVTISIYNLMGQRLRTFESNNTKAGYHQVQWNSLTKTGRNVPSGLYIVRMNAASTNGKKSFNKSQKIVLLK